MKKLIMSVIMCATLVFMSACGSSGGGSSDAVSAGAGTTGTSTDPTVTAINNANEIESLFNAWLKKVEDDTNKNSYSKEIIDNGVRITAIYNGFENKEVIEFTKPLKNRVILVYYFYEKINEEWIKTEYEKNEIRAENDGLITIVLNSEEYNNSKIAKINGVSSFNSLKDFKSFLESEDKLTGADFSSLSTKFLSNGFSGGALSSNSERFIYTRYKDNLTIYVELDGHISVRSDSTVKTFNRNSPRYEQLTVDAILKILYAILDEESITEENLNSLGFI